MELSIEINQSTCILCKKCIRVCPAGILELPEGGEAVQCHHVENCIRCGHCVAVCPTGALEHSVFPPEKIHAIDRKSLPTPEQLLLLCRARRSNRALLPDPVPQEYLDLILEAAHRAPTASNLQQVSFTLVTDPKKLRQVADITIDTFASLAKKLSMPLVKPLVRKMMPEIYRMIPRFARMKEEHEAGNDPILRKTTALIFIHTPSSNRFGCDDANLAYQNGSLMAESLGVSQIYTGFVCTGIKQDKKKRINKLLEIEGEIHAGMALAMSAFLFPNYIDKNENAIKRWQ